MTTTTITNFRKNLFEYVKSAIEYNEVIDISTKDGSAVVLSRADYEAMLETMYVMNIPGMAQRLEKAAAASDEDVEDYDPDEEW